MGTCASTSSITVGASSKRSGNRLSLQAIINPKDELTSEMPDELFVDPLEKLGVSVHYLKNFFLDEVLLTPGLSRDSTIYDCEKLEGPPGVIRQTGEDVICPIDGQLGAAYVHCLDGEDEVGDANFMLSYSWGYSIGDIIDSLDYHCATQYLDPKRTYVWMCCLCVNQHRNKNQRSSMLPDNIKNFEDEFLGRMLGIGHVLAMMAPWTFPLYLSRVWCIYEIYAASEHGCKITVITPPTQRKAIEAALVQENGKDINTLYDTIRETRIEEADASVEADRQMILAIVKQKPGFSAFNQYINDTCREWLGGLIEETVKIRGEGAANRGTSIPFAHFCNRVGMIFSENGEYNRALKMYQKSRTIIEKLEGEDHPLTAMPYHNIGVALDNMENFDEAVVAYRKCVSIYKSIGGEELRVAELHNSIGVILKQTGDFESALEEYQAANLIFETVLGKQHPVTAKSYITTGAVHRHMGNVDDALRDYREALSIQEQVLGDHPDTALSHCEVGHILKDKGEYDGALWRLRKGLAMNERLLGNDHPRTAISYKDIGLVLQKSGDIDEALIMYRRALAIQEAALGQHTDTAATHKVIGTLLKEKGDLEGALMEFKNAKVINESVLGKAHLSTASSYNNIAVVLQMKGDIDGAIMYLRGVANIYEKTMGKNHPDTAKIYKKIGLILMNMRDYEGALVEYNKALEIYEAKWGGQHAEVASSHKAIGVVLAKKGDFKEALVELDFALTIQKSVFGENHATTRDTKYSIKNVLEAQKDHR